MSQYIKFDFDAAAQLQEVPPATPAAPATQQEKSSECSKGSTGVPPASQYLMSEEMVQSIADAERRDLYDDCRGLATFATLAIQEGQSSERSRSSNPSLSDASPITAVPCPHARTGRRADGTRVCLACVAVYVGGVWTPQTIAYCATEHVPYESTSTDGPTRQCQACPHAWQVPCACGTASWKSDAHWGPDGAGVVRWTCTSCGASYAPDPREDESYE